MTGVKFFAFYLPQFHPFEENNAWWGKGFTEWTNVAPARPRYKGHYQPHLPADLGFYDLRLEESRRDQAKMARESGIYGFCYYHYWFNGEPLMDQVMEMILESGSPDLPFFLCWANENWTRAWDGQDRQVLIKHEYSSTDDKEHLKYLAKFFSDPRYEKIDGCPVLAIYRPDHLPDPRDFLYRIRGEARSLGFPGVYFVGVKSGLVGASEEEILGYGFDSIIDFQPNRDHFPKDGSFSYYMNLARKLIPRNLYQLIKTNANLVKRVSYEKFVQVQVHRHIGERIHPTVFPSWDNSARRRTPTIIENHSAADFKKWLQHAYSHSANSSLAPRWVFVNAWNEWAEGCHLEPDRLHGQLFLSVIAEVSKHNRDEQESSAP